MERSTIIFLPEVLQVTWMAALSEEILSDIPHLLRELSPRQSCMRQRRKPVKFTDLQSPTNFHPLLERPLCKSRV